MFTERAYIYEGRGKAGGKQMDRWRQVCRDGLAPVLSTDGLTTLADALGRDDPCLVQGHTCVPPALQACSDELVEAACAIGFCGWQGEGLLRVGEVEDFFRQACDRADEALGEPAACRFFLHWFDRAPRAVMRRELMAEVGRALRRRRAEAA